MALYAVRLNSGLHGITACKLTDGRIVGKRRAESKLAKLADAVRRVRFTDWFGWRCMVGPRLLRSTKPNACVGNIAQHTANPARNEAARSAGQLQRRQGFSDPNWRAWFDATTVSTLSE